MMARVMVGAHCIHRFCGETKVYTFSANNFIRAATREIAKYEDDKQAKTVQKSSIAKVTFKSRKQHEEFNIDGNDSFGSGIDTLCKYLHGCSKKGIPVDWTLQYEKLKAPSNPVIDINSSDSEQEMKPTSSKDRKHLVNSLL
jgi:hypothetical protein